MSDAAKRLEEVEITFSLDKSEAEVTMEIDGGRYVMGSTMAEILRADMDHIVQAIEYCQLLLVTATTTCCVCNGSGEGGPPQSGICHECHGSGDLPIEHTFPHGWDDLS